MNYKNKLGVLVCLSGLMMVLPAHAQTAFTADGLVHSTAGGFKFPDGTVQKTSAVPAGPYVIGGTGPAGGLVFFVTNDGTHGMEAAPSDSGPATGVAWGCQGTQVGAFAKGIGSGARNTDAILRGCGVPDIAAALADELASSSGYFDWHLPTRFDLNLMYLLLHSQGLGNFCGGSTGSCFYWSSSEFDELYAVAKDFGNGDPVAAFKDVVLPKVRAVRAF